MENLEKKERVRPIILSCLVLIVTLCLLFWHLWICLFQQFIITKKKSRNNLRREVDPLFVPALPILM